ncbi:hypothetical protein RhiirA4_481160 [Rhizophagus irregularis]|uniref:Uncharacterized protein n=1 Tax=Rhizophagus irregularis TaxID=588596 RepID=A0A2I1HJ25_9GLOM|nr:hypothetical protein RhiirA4_481160 [Rhizophagus irregularis]
MELSIPLFSERASLNPATQHSNEVSAPKDSIARNICREEILRMLSINVTFNTFTEDTSAGKASVAQQMLYEHFIYGSETLNFEQFMGMCDKNWKFFNIATACDVILMRNM